MIRAISHFHVLMLFAASMSGVANAVDWRIDLSEPGSQALTIHATVPAESISGRDVVLTFNDTLPEKADRVHTLSATQGGKQLTADAILTKPKLQFRIESLSANEPLTISYQMNPVFYPPGSPSEGRGEARGILDAEAAVLRTRTIFPNMNVRANGHRVSLALPENWRVVAPWHRDGDSYQLSRQDLSVTDYIVAGDMSVESREVGGTEIRVGIFADTGVSAADIVRILDVLSRDFGPVPGGEEGPRCVAVMPPGFMQGGSAGNRSSVQNRHVVTLTHELFHWWNHGSYGLPETRWYGEGVTNYVAVRYAQEAGLIAEDRVGIYFADLHGEMRYLEESGPISLVRSGDLASKDHRMSRVNYSKGALLMWLLQAQVGESGSDVTGAIRRVAQESSRNFSNEFLFDVFREELGQDASDLLRHYVTEAERLPHLPFGPATGDSGIARYLPE